MNHILKHKSFNIRKYIQPSFAGILFILFTTFGLAENPSIYFDTTTYSFGTVNAYQKVVQRIKFENKSSNILTLQNIKSSCDCVSAEIKTQNVPPHSTGEINIIVEPKGETGDKSGSMFVFSNDPEHSPVELKIKVYSVSNIIATPAALDFGTLVLGNTTTFRILLVNKDNTKIKITHFPSAPTFLSLGVLSSKLYSNNTAGISIIIPSSLQTGKYAGTIHVIGEGLPSSSFEIPVTGNIIGEYTLTPERIYFGLIKKNTLATISITIVPNSGKRVKITKIDCPLQGIQCRINPGKTPSGIQLVARIDTKNISGQIKGFVTLYTDSKLQNKIEIPVYALVQ